MFLSVCMSVRVSAIKTSGSAKLILNLKRSVLSPSAISVFIYIYKYIYLSLASWPALLY